MSQARERRYDILVSMSYPTVWCERKNFVFSCDDKEKSAHIVIASSSFIFKITQTQCLQASSLSQWRWKEALWSSFESVLQTKLKNKEQQLTELFILCNARESERNGVKLIFEWLKIKLMNCLSRSYFNSYPLSSLVMRGRNET